MAALSSYTPISTQTLSSGSTSITFNSFTGYTDLVLVCNVYGTANYSGFIRFNGDTGSNYSSTTLQGNGSTVTSGRASSDSSIYIMTKGVGFDPSYLTTGIINIQNYSNSTTYKTVLSRSGVVRASVGETTAFVGTWRNTAAITSFTIISDGGTYATGSTFSLYGIANNTAGAKATGGVITSDSDYFYHSFYATGTFTPSSALTGADVLVVGGGGGASSGDAAGQGGGGAGGYRAFTSQSFASGTAYTCTVGAGGTGALYASAAGSATGSSIAGTGFTTINASAGGAGSSYNGGGSNGGSGGGAGTPGNNSGGSGNSGGYSPVEGYAGGGSFTSGAYYTGGGGGGSSAAGANAVSGSNAGAGGAGTQWYNGNYYAGGGGGGHNQSSTITLGGSGVGGNGGIARSVAGTSGVVNTGSGGGGGAGLSGGSGASGVVIIRYAR